MPFQTKAITELPKREAPKPKEVDLAAANELFALLSKDGKPATMPDPADPKRGRVTVTAEDGVVYDSTKNARNAANVAKRLLLHVTPDGLFVKTRVYATGENQHAFAIWLSTEAPPEKKAKSK